VEKKIEPGLFIDSEESRYLKDEEKSA